METLVLFVLLCRVCTGSSESVRAEVGEDVILPCVQNTSSEVQTVGWSRPDLGDRSVHFYRDGRDSLENQNTAYTGRTAMFSEEMKTGNVSVKLSRVRLSDAGLYRCYLHDPDQETWVTLDVADVVPEDPWLIVLGVVVGVVSISAVIALCLCLPIARFRSIKKDLESTKEKLDFTIGRLSYVKTRLSELGVTKGVHESIRGYIEELLSIRGYIDELRVPEQAEKKNLLDSRVMDVKLKIQEDIEETRTQKGNLKKRIQELKERQVEPRMKLKRMLRRAPCLRCCCPKWYDEAVVLCEEDGEEAVQAAVRPSPLRRDGEEGASLEMVPLATENREDAVVDMGVVPDDQDSVGVAQEPGPPTTEAPVRSGTP